jgi:hypothetical protein
MAKRRKAQRDRKRIDLDAVEPIVLDADGDEDDVEEIHVFTLNGKDYFMPTVASFHTAIRTMEIYASKGEAAATAYQLRELLGDEGYEALINYPRLRAEDFNRICELASDIVLASREGKAQSPSDGGKSDGSRSTSMTSSRTRSRTTT